MEKKPTSRVKIRFQDCDPFNHLNNGRFLDYFFNAREDHLTEHYNLDIFTQLKKTGCAWVVASNQIAYLKPAMVAEEVVIETKLIERVWVPVKTTFFETRIGEIIQLVKSGKPV